MRSIKIKNQITNKDSEALGKYLAELNKKRSRVISADEEVALAVRIRQGDQQAHDDLVCANLRFVVSVAKQYDGYGVPLQDLVNDGNVGLIKAAKKFDHTKGFKFISYAVWWIRQAMLAALTEQVGQIRLPVNIRNDIGKVSRAIQRFESEHGTPPSFEEISSELKMEPEQIAKLQKWNVSTTSLDRALDDDVEGILLKTVKDEGPAPDDHLMDDALRLKIEQLLGLIDEENREILKRYFGIGGYHPHTLDEIGSIMKLSRERVRQKKSASLRKIFGMATRRGILPG